MKKVLTILAVLIVLTSAVFAASEVHTIRVKADVTEVVPAFQLWLGTTTTKTNATPVAFTDNATYNLVDDASAIDTGFNLDQNGSVTVYAVLANKAKINKAYTLTFSDGKFSVTKNGVAGTHDPAIVTEALSPVIDGTSAIAKLDDAVADSPVKVTFNGTTVTATNPKLATATYSYTADPEIDPTPAGVFYYANIVLTVSTT